MQTPHPSHDEPEFDDASIEAVLSLDPDGELGLVKELVETFRHDAQAKVAGLRERIAAGDAAGVHTLTHQLKSSAGSLGLARVMRLSRDIDEDSRRGGLERAIALIDALESGLETGLVWLEAKAGIGG